LDKLAKNFTTKYKKLQELSSTFLAKWNHPNGDSQNLDKVVY